MWKTRVIACIEKAIQELSAEALRRPDPDATMGTQFDMMASNGRLEDHIKKLTVVLNEVKATKRAPTIDKG